MLTTYERTSVVTPARQGMRVPVLSEFIAILLNIAHKQKLEGPNMFRVFSVKFVIPLEPRKESTPQSGKMSAHLHPKSLNAGVRC